MFMQGVRDGLLVIILSSVLVMDYKVTHLDRKVSEKEVVCVIGRGG